MCRHVTGLLSTPILSRTSVDSWDLPQVPSSSLRPHASPGPLPGLRDSCHRRSRQHDVQRRCHFRLQYGGYRELFGLDRLRGGAKPDSPTVTQNPGASPSPHFQLESSVAGVTGQGEYAKAARNEHDRWASRFIGVESVLAFGRASSTFVVQVELTELRLCSFLHPNLFSSPV